MSRNILDSDRKLYSVAQKSSKIYLEYNATSVPGNEYMRTFHKPADCYYKELIVRRMSTVLDIIQTNREK